MAEDTPPRQMSLIPYPNDSREIVLRRGNAIVVYDPLSRQLQVTNDPDQLSEFEAECPYCHRPYHDDVPRESGDGHSGPFVDSERPFVDPEYFGMLAASRQATPNPSGPTTPSRRLVPAALRSGRSRDVSGSAEPPSGAEFVASEPAASSAQGISRSAFSPGYFKQFFVEKGVLGKGGNGVVLLVEHVMDRVPLGQFACKRVPVGNNHKWLERVLVEVKLLQRIPHKNVVAYQWAWLEDYQQSRFAPSIPCLWILQEYCNGGDLHTYVLGPKAEPSTAEKLKDRLRRRSRGDPEPPTELRGRSKLTFDEIFSFFRDITSGLHHLHGKGYIHRDLKPSNCLLQKDGGKTRVLISDFGEVQAAGDKRGSSGATGTISYCAPEVLQRDSPDGMFGDFTTKSDIFSLGMIVYFMCFGRLPYSNADDINEEKEDLDELRAEIVRWPGFDDETRARPDLPEKLYKFLKRLLSVDPNERPSTGDILESIRTSGNLSDLNADDVSPRVASLDASSHRPSPPGRRQSAYVSKPGISTLPRQRSDEVAARSRSPIKARAGSRSREHSRPDSAMTIRPRKIEAPALNADDVELPPEQLSPRLMLPPPPPRPVANRFQQFVRLPAASNGFRAVLFAAKLLIMFVPCAPYAANAWLLYPLLAMAALDVGLLSFDLRRSVALLGMHVAIAMVARQYGRLCERPGVLWKDLDTRGGS